MISNVENKSKLVIASVSLWILQHFLHISKENLNATSTWKLPDDSESTVLMHKIYRLLDDENSLIDILQMFEWDFLLRRVHLSQSSDLRFSNWQKIPFYVKCTSCPSENHSYTH